MTAIDYEQQMKDLAERLNREYEEERHCCALICNELGKYAIYGEDTHGPVDVCEKHLVTGLNQYTQFKFWILKPIERTP